MKSARWSLAGILTVIAVLGIGGTRALAQSAQPAAGNPDAELKTAITHAEFAAKADAVKGVTMHLHHVLNCLVGPQDKRFDAAAGNPCQGQGGGFLPDLKAKKGEDAQYHEAWWVATIADQGTKTDNLGQAKAAAQVASLVLQDVGKMK